MKSQPRLLLFKLYLWFHGKANSIDLGEGKFAPESLMDFFYMNE